MLMNIAESPILAKNKQYAMYGKVKENMYLIVWNLRYRRGDRRGSWEMKVYDVYKSQTKKVFVHPFAWSPKAFGRIDLSEIESKFEKFVYEWNKDARPYVELRERLELKFLSENPNEIIKD